MLLGFEAVHVDGQFRRHEHIGQIDELPSPHLRAVAEIEIFGERVVMPAIGVLNAGLAPDACSAVELKKPSAAAARRCSSRRCPSRNIACTLVRSE